MPKDLWQTISLSPSGLFDSRSVPADLPPGAYRWRENVQVLTDGKTRRRPQFSRFYNDLLFDGVYHNHDFHHQGATREPPNMEFEATSNAGTRTLFLGTPTSLQVLDEATGYWTPIKTGITDSGYHWKGAVLEDVAVFVNNGTVLYHDLGSSTAQTIPELAARGITAARIALSWSGFMILMNVIQDGDRFTTRISWGDYKLPLAWNLATADTLAGKQDLDYGDEILAAVPMGNFVFICTRKSIWKMTVSGVNERTFDFQRVYNEPKNQAGCLVYPNTLVSDGSNIWYMSSDTVYKFNQFLAAPQKDDYDKTDWLHRATGVIYTDPMTRMSGEDCESPIAEYLPLTKELVFSWPSAGSVYNNWTLRGMIDFKTGDVDPHGWLCFTNFRRTPTDKCNELQDFIGVSSVDWCIKSIGNVLYREFVRTGADPTEDLDQDAPPVTYYRVGYNSILRGAIPIGLPDREKILGSVVELDHETSDQDIPCVVNLRIGNSFKIVDPNSQEAKCSPLWRDLGDKQLSCPDEQTLSQMAADNLKPDALTQWAVYEQNRYLYFEFTIRNADGTPAIGADVYLAKISFNAAARPKV